MTEFLPVFYNTTNFHVKHPKPNNWEGAFQFVKLGKSLNTVKSAVMVMS